MKKIIVALTFAFILFGLIFVKDVSADNGQYGPYGSTPPSQSILVDKMVGKPVTNGTSVTDVEYVDNLSPSDPRFAANQQVYFRLRVKNTSNIKQYNITVKDFLPDYLNPILGPGSWDLNTRTITLNAGDFEANEEKIYYFVSQIYTQDKLPVDKGLFCEINRAQAYNDKVSDDDTSQFCIEKTVGGVSQVPSTGSETVVLLASMLSMGAGMFLKKKTS